MPAPKTGGLKPRASLIGQRHAQVSEAEKRRSGFAAHEWTAVGLGLVLLLTGVVGCRTTEQRVSADTASIVIHGKSEQEIRRAALEVFKPRHYQVGASAPRELVFEKKAGAMSNVLYGGWPGADQAVWERVKLSFLPKGDDAFEVDLNAFLVTDKGEEFFEQEKKRSQLHFSYKKWLRAIQDKLK